MPRRWRHDSVFGDGLRSPRDREWMAVWKARLRLLYQGGKITAKCLLIGLAMAEMLGADGRLDPSHDTIAERTHAGSRTVRRALARLSELRMVQWVRRLVRIGSDVRQDTNSYGLSLPALAAGHYGRETLKQGILTVAATASRAAKNAVEKVMAAWRDSDALRAHRVAMEARLRWPRHTTLGRA